MWQQLSSRILLAHPRVTVVEDEIALPSGEHTKYLRFDNEGDAVSLVCRRDDGRILLQREYSYPVDAWEYQLPAGIVKPGEDLQSAANRELMEESGFRANKLRSCGYYYFNNRRSNQKMYVYIGSDLVDESLAADAEEVIENVWHTEEEIHGLIATGDIRNLTILAGLSLVRAFPDSAA